ncbi:MAG: hypothetical protein ACJ72V_06115 [Nitrososphaeraceae archaeon]
MEHVVGRGDGIDAIDRGKKYVTIFCHRSKGILMILIFISTEWTIILISFFHEM